MGNTGRKDRVRREMVGDGAREGGGGEEGVQNQHISILLLPAGKR